MKSARREIDVVTRNELGGGGSRASQTASTIRGDLQADGTDGRSRIEFVFSAPEPIS